MTLEATMIHSLQTLDQQQTLADLDLLSKEAVEMPPAIPIEQIKGDISRAGHPVQRLMALDPDSRRLFFTDVKGNFMYAEFAEADDAYRVTKVGFQTEIAKEYGASLQKAFDAVDLEAEPLDTVTSAHEEREVDYTEPGMHPSGTPGEKPIDLNNDGFADVSTVPTREPVGDIKERHEENTHFNRDAHDEQMKKELDVTMDIGELGTFMKQPPRPGLVPESGDPQHPYRWIKPESDPSSGGPQGDYPPTEEDDYTGVESPWEEEEEDREAERLGLDGIARDNLAAAKAEGREKTYEFDVSADSREDLDSLIDNINAKGLEARVTSLSGPGGGNPVIEVLAGNGHDVAGVMSEYGYDDDPSDFDEIYGITKSFESLELESIMDVGELGTIMFKGK